MNADQFWHRPRFSSSPSAAPRNFAVRAPLEQSNLSEAARDAVAVITVIAFVVVTAAAIGFGAFLCLFCSF